MSYFKDIQSGIRTTIRGLSLTLRHLRQATKRRKPDGIASDNYFDLQNGLVTLQYPHEQLPIPDNGRYKLRNEIEDCIVCDKCAKVCPVDCITIDAIKATEEVGKASDGSPIRLYAAKFDIDMAKCCYCGLCTVVCPTECLTMDKEFDYSTFELGKLTYSFAELTVEQADEKRALYEQYVREKDEAKAAKQAVKAPAPVTEAAATAPKRPVFRPTAKPSAPVPPAEPVNSEGSSIDHPLTDATPNEMQQIAQGGLEVAKHPVFEPTEKPIVPAPVADGSETITPAAPEPVAKSQIPAPSPKPAGFRPTMKPPVAKATEPPVEVPATDEPAKPKSAFRPTMKPSKAIEPKPEETQAHAENQEEPPKPKPAAFRPTMKPAKSADPDSAPSEPTDAPKSKPAAFRPTMKPAVAVPKPVEEAPLAEPISPVTDSTVNTPLEPTPEPAKPKPAFRPTMKPKPKPDDETSD